VEPFWGGGFCPLFGWGVLCLGGVLFWGGAFDSFCRDFPLSLSSRSYKREMLLTT